MADPMLTDSRLTDFSSHKNKKKTSLNYHEGAVRPPVLILMEGLVDAADAATQDDGRRHVEESLKVVSSSATFVAAVRRSKRHREREAIWWEGKNSMKDAANCVNQCEQGCRTSRDI